MLGTYLDLVHARDATPPLLRLSKSKFSGLVCTSGTLRFTSFPYLAPKTQRVQKGCHEQNEGVNSDRVVTLTLLAVGPSAEEGPGHVNMTRRETPSCRAC